MLFCNCLGYWSGLIENAWIVLYFFRVLIYLFFYRQDVFFALFDVSLSARYVYGLGLYCAVFILLLDILDGGGVVMKRSPESPLNFWFRAVSRRHREREIGGAFSKVLMC